MTAGREKPKIIKLTQKNQIFESKVSKKLLQNRAYYSIIINVAV